MGLYAHTVLQTKLCSTTLGPNPAALGPGSEAGLHRESRGFHTGGCQLGWTGQINLFDMGLHAHTVLWLPTTELCYTTLGPNPAASKPGSEAEFHRESGGFHT